MGLLIENKDWIIESHCYLNIVIGRWGPTHKWVYLALTCMSGSNLGSKQSETRSLFDKYLRLLPTPNTTTVTIMLATSASNIQLVLN